MQQLFQTYRHSQRLSRCYGHLTPNARSCGTFFQASVTNNTHHPKLTDGDHGVQAGPKAPAEDDVTTKMFEESRRSVSRQ